MPLKAITDAGVTLLSFVLADIEKITALSTGALRCPQCDGVMKFIPEHKRMGYKVASYFAHRNTQVCLTDFEHHPESPEHLMAKAELARTLPLHYAEYRAAECVVEYRIPEIKRIADVCFIFADGLRVVHEAQLADISLSEIQARTRDYHSQGIEVVWHLGRNVRKHEAWCMEHLGTVGTVEFSYATETTDLSAPPRRAA